MITDRWGRRLEGAPKRIVIERTGAVTPRWRFDLLTDQAELVDYSFASTRWLAWRMARSAFRRADRQARQ